MENNVCCHLNRLYLATPDFYRVWYTQVVHYQLASAISTSETAKTGYMSMGGTISTLTAGIPLTSEVVVKKGIVLLAAQAHAT